jgi:hypothetical protein
MALKAALTSEAYEQLPPTIKEHYKKSEGDDASKAFVLDAEGVEDVGGLKSALVKEREARGTAETQYRDIVTKYKDIDPEKARAAQEKLDEIEQKKLEDAQEYEQAKARIQSEKETEVNTVKSEYGEKLTKTTSKLREVMIDRALAEEAAKHDPFLASLPAFVELARKHVSMDDEYNVVVTGEKGNNIAELVSNLKETDEFGIFFKSDIATGSGASNQNNKGGGQPAGAKKASEMSTMEKSAFIREHGLDAWKTHVAKG